MQDNSRILARVTKARKPRVPKMLAPCECSNLRQIQRIESNFQVNGDVSINTVGATVGITTDRTIVLMRDEFNACIRWWQKKQKVKK